MQQPDFDVGIVGGGPAGAGLAAYLAKAGVSCVVFESSLFPRRHVGESLVPSSTRVFKDLDFVRVMERERFPRKYGAVWTSTSAVRELSHDWAGLDPDCYVDVRFGEREPRGRSTLPSEAVSPLFQAALEATEEAVYNSLLQATSVTSRGRTVEAIPIDRLKAILQRYGRGR